MDDEFFKAKTSESVSVNFFISFLPIIVFFELFCCFKDIAQTGLTVKSGLVGM